MLLASHQWVALLMSQRFNEIISTLLEQPVAHTAGCLWNSWNIYVWRSWSARIWWDSHPSIGYHCPCSSRAHASECSRSKDDCWMGLLFLTKDHTALSTVLDNTLKQQQKRKAVFGDGEPCVEPMCLRRALHQWGWWFSNPSSPPLEILLVHFLSRFPPIYFLLWDSLRLKISGL